VFGSFNPNLNMQRIKLCEKVKTDGFDETLKQKLLDSPKSQEGESSFSEEDEEIGGAGEMIEGRHKKPLSSTAEED